MLNQILRRLLYLESGKNCRCCTEMIPQSDPFGMSEGVCEPCRA